MGTRMKEIAGLSREVIRNIWRNDREGKPLTREETRIANILRAHREYAWAWEGKSPPGTERETTLNPFLHVHIHGIVEKQLRENEPRETAAAVAVLEERGMERHQAVHTIGMEFLRELYAMTKQKAGFDYHSYAARLSRLAAFSSRNTNKKGGRV